MKLHRSFTSSPLPRIACSCLFAAALAAALGAVASSRAISGPKNPAQLAAERKVASLVSARTENGKQAEFIIVLNDQADLSGAASLKTKATPARSPRLTIPLAMAGWIFWRR